MLYNFKEYGKYAEITGYRNIKFGDTEAFLKANRKQTQNLDLQFLDAELIATKEHIYFAVLNALAAFNGMTNVSKSLAMETMLYASAKRQIQRAIEQCGIKPQTTNLAVAIIGVKPEQINSVLETVTACISSEPDEQVLEMSKAKEKKIKEAFQISDKEIKAVLKNQDYSGAIVNLVIERVALLATQL
jgi:tRNA threonylcarbamoyladenosine modification (KEOPS) complex Cgi121 subunit